MDEALANEFLQQIEDHKKLIYKVSHMYCNTEIDKTDLFQEIIVNLWKGYPKFRGAAKLSTWIYKVSINTAITWLRNDTKINNHIDYTNLLPNLPENGDFDELYEHLYSAIGHLGKIDKAIILLQLEGYSYDDIAEITGLTKTNVATRLNRIKQKLKGFMLNR